MKIGFIGLGMMGKGMAANLQKNGHELIVHDLFRDSAKSFIDNGAVWAESPKALAEQCELIFTSLPTPGDMEAVCYGENGLAKGFRKGAAWFDLTTNALDVVRRVNGEMAKQGVSLMDAPVSGGPTGAASGKLAILVGGDKAVWDRYESILKSIADKAQYVGDIGAGTIVKLAHNMASTAIKSVVAEVLTMGVKAGMDPLPLWEAMRSGAAGRMRGFDNIQRYLAGDIETPSFALRLMQKDVNLALALGKQYDVPMRVCNAVGQDVHEAMARGFGNKDSQALLSLQTERAGIAPIKVSKDEIKRVLDAG